MEVNLSCAVTLPWLLFRWLNPNLNKDMVFFYYCVVCLNMIICRDNFNHATGRNNHMEVKKKSKTPLSIQT